MKKLILILALFLLAPVSAFSQSWMTANQVTVAWDAVVLPAGVSGSVVYDIYTVGSTAAKSTAAKVTRATTTQQTISFSTEGKYYVGVKSVRVLSGADVSESAISWSDDPLAVSAAGTFGIVYYIAPAAVKNLRPVQ